MTDRLVIHDGDLSGALNTIASVRSEFDGVSSGTADARDAVGQPDLADALRRFVDSWTLHRARLSNDLATLEDNLRQTITTFEQVDAELARDAGGVA